MARAGTLPPTEQRTGADRAKGSRWFQDVTRGAAAHRERSASPLQLSRKETAREEVLLG